MPCIPPASLPLRMLDRDGLRLAVHDSGPVPRPASGPASGPLPPLVCIHGNSCDHGFFAPLAAHFAPARRVLAVDLRGHGESGKPQGAYPFRLFAEDCLWIMDRLRLPAAVLVAHSMGGAIAVEMANQRPERVRALALLDSTLEPLAPEAAAAVPHLLQTLDTDRYLAAFDAFFRAMFLPPGKARCPQAFRDAIRTRMVRTPRHVMHALMADLLDYPGADLEALDMPMLYIGAERERSDPEALGRDAPAMQLERLRGLGHFLMLEDPDAVHQLLERFLAGVDAAAGD